MLQSVRIVEIEGIGPGPFAAMTLADLGAEVITIHRADPPEARAAQPANPLDRGKRSITLDLKDPEDVKVAKALIATADGLIEGMRPGVMERLGLYRYAVFGNIFWHTSGMPTRNRIPEHVDLDQHAIFRIHIKNISVL